MGIQLSRSGKQFAVQLCMADSAAIEFQNIQSEIPSDLRMAEVDKEKSDPEFPDFERWHAEIGGDLLRFCVSRLGSVAGEDVYQQVWLKAIRQHHQFNGANERAWLFQIARTTIVDWTRKKRPKSNSAKLAHVAQKNSQPEFGGFGSEQLERFKTCLARLTPEKRDLLHLRVTGHSYKQISAALSIAIGTVGSKYNRICEQLKTCVEPAK